MATGSRKQVTGIHRYSNFFVVDVVHDVEGDFVPTTGRRKIFNTKSSTGKSNRS